MHLEAVSDLSKEAYVMTFRRFVARRGKPAEVFSDNGRNFVAAAKVLSIFLNNKIHLYLSLQLRRELILSLYRLTLPTLVEYGRPGSNPQNIILNA